MQGKATGRRAPLGNQRSLSEGKSNGLGRVSKTSNHWKPCFQTLEASFPIIGKHASIWWKHSETIFNKALMRFPHSPLKKRYNFCLIIVKSDSTICEFHFFCVYLQPKTWSMIVTFNDFHLRHSTLSHFMVTRREDSLLKPMISIVWNSH